MDNDLWPRIEAGIRALDGRQEGREVSWLAAVLKTTIQRVNNWKTRGVPADQHAKVAAALGWSVEELLGKAQPAKALVWPFELVDRARFEALSPVQRGFIEAAILKALDELDARRPAAEPTLSKRVA